MNRRSAKVSLFGDRRQPVGDAVDLTIASLLEYGKRHRHWGIAWSGGKDSTALVTLVVYLIESGKIPRPESLTILYADTRMELTPLSIAAARVSEIIRERGIEVRIVTAPLDKRFLVYILGRGVPPPNNNTLRWCTRQIKVDPMVSEVERLHQDRSEKILMLTGVRQGESAQRDDRIAMSCSRNGAECGQGWYQQALPTQICATLAPILHWRVCNVWDWLHDFAPMKGYGGWPTRIISDAYGGEEAEEINARTGCIGCPLAARDTALESVVLIPEWKYLTPLLQLKQVYRDLRDPGNRLRKSGGERRKDGSLTKNQNRMGPITLTSRLTAMERILSIQSQVNSAADSLGRPRVDILNLEEESRIRELIAQETWPDGWTGDEPVADQPFDAWDSLGRVQRSLFASLEG